MKKNTIKLNEASLRKIVAESVKKVLKESEEQYQVVLYDGNRPTQCLFRGTEEECKTVEAAYDIMHKNGRLVSRTEPVNVDEFGEPESFLGQRDEYDHCAEMGDFDEY